MTEKILYTDPIAGITIKKPYSQRRSLTAVYLLFLVPIFIVLYIIYILLADQYVITNILTTLQGPVELVVGALINLLIFTILLSFLRDSLFHFPVVLTDTKIMFEEDFTWTKIFSKNMFKFKPNPIILPLSKIKIINNKQILKGRSRPLF